MGSELARIRDYLTKSTVASGRDGPPDPRVVQKARFWPQCRILRGTATTAASIQAACRATLPSLVTMGECLSAGAASHLHSTHARRRDRREEARLDERPIVCWRRGPMLLEAPVATWNSGPHWWNSKLIWSPQRVYSRDQVHFARLRKLCQGSLLCRPSLRR